MTFINQLIATFETFGNNVARLLDSGTESMIIGIVLIILFGIIFGIFGYRIYRWILAINGAVAFGVIAWAIAGIKNLSIYPQLLIIIAAAVCGALIGYYLYQLGLFIFGFLCGISLTLLAMTVNEIPQNNNAIIIILAIGITGGILTVFFTKFIIIVSYAFSGATLIITGIQQAILLYASENYSFALKLKTELNWLIETEFLLYAGIPLAICFIYIQYGLDKRNKGQTLSASERLQAS